MLWYMVLWGAQWSWDLGRMCAFCLSSEKLSRNKTERAVVLTGLVMTDL